MRRALVGFVLSAALAACGGELTSGGVGELEVVIAADSLAVDGSAVAGFPSPHGSGPSRQLPPPIEGTLELTVRSFIREAGGRWIELTDGPEDVVLTLTPTGAGGEGEAAILARRELEAGRYDAIRTRYLRVEAEIESGLEIGGEPFTGEVAVDLGPAGRIEALAEIELELTESRESSVVVNLHARRWLLRLDREPGRARVEGDDFERELRVRGR